MKRTWPYLLAAPVIIAMVFFVIWMFSLFGRE